MTYEPIKCDCCDASATKKITFLLTNARGNPASSGYRKDDISWCQDFAAFACDEHEKQVDGRGYRTQQWRRASDRRALSERLGVAMGENSDALKPVPYETGELPEPNDTVICVDNAHHDRLVCGAEYEIRFVGPQLITTSCGVTGWPDRFRLVSRQMPGVKS